MHDTKSVNVEVKEMPELTVTYLRHVGPMQETGAVSPALHEALPVGRPRGLIGVPTPRSSPCTTMIRK